MQERLARATRRLLVAGTILSLGFLGAGCGGSASKLAHITGTVKFNGQPLPRGALAFVYTDATGTTLDSRSSPIFDGKYELKDAPTGKATVTVRVQKFMRAPGEQSEQSKAEDAKFVEIPEKYADAKKSGIEKNVTGGNNTIDIDLQ